MLTVNTICKQLNEEFISPIGHVSIDEQRLNRIRLIDYGDESWIVKSIIIRRGKYFGKGTEQGKHSLVSDMYDVECKVEDWLNDGKGFDTLFLYVEGK